MVKQLIAPLLADLLLLAGAVWMLRLLWQQTVFTGALRWVMLVCAALLVALLAAAAVSCVTGWLRARRGGGKNGSDSN